MIVGADGADDRTILAASASLLLYGLRRVYYSAFSPIPDASAKLPLKAPPLRREHRLYQADWLFRFYGFAVEELLLEHGSQMLDLEIDPKLAWALQHGRCSRLILTEAAEQLLARAWSGSAQRSSNFEAQAAPCGPARGAEQTWRVSVQDRALCGERSRGRHQPRSPRPARSAGAHRAAPAVPLRSCLMPASTPRRISRSGGASLGRRFGPSPARAGGLARPRQRAGPAGQRVLRGENLATIRVPPRFVDLARQVICHRSGERLCLLYRLLWRITHGERALLEICVDPDVRHAVQMAKAVRRDVHKMKAFVRFRQVAGVEPEQFVAWFEPQHHVVSAVAPFFRARFASMRWSILTPESSVHWDGAALSLPRAPGDRVPWPMMPSTISGEPTTPTFSIPPA